MIKIFTPAIPMQPMNNSCAAEITERRFSFNLFEAFATEAEKESARRRMFNAGFHDALLKPKTKETYGNA